MPFQNPSPQVIRDILARARTIAVVGLSPKLGRPSHGVAAAMQNFGYRIIPVRPAMSEVLGEKAYADLREVPDTIDIVDVFRATKHIGPIVDACIEMKLPVLWLQLGIIDEVEAARAQAAGITVIMDRCIYLDYMEFRH